VLATLHESKAPRTGAVIPAAKCKAVSVRVERCRSDVNAMSERPAFTSTHTYSEAPMTSIPDALRQHLDWHERMKRYFSTPALAEISKQWKRESELMARAVGSLKLNLKDSTR
jgi:hypothetical protein